MPATMPKLKLPIDIGKRHLFFSTYLFFILILLFAAADKLSPQKKHLSYLSPQNYAKTLVKSIEKKIPTQTFVGKTTTAKSGGEKGPQTFGRTIIPTVLGTVSQYTGASSFNYSISTPQGPAGFSPSLGLSYSSATIDDARAGNDRWQDTYAIPPSPIGQGFSISGLGVIVRDTRGNLGIITKRKQDGTEEIYHRFILSFPSGSYELKYNSQTRQWTTTPQGFLRIDHDPPTTLATIKQNRTPYNFKVVDPDEWVITTKDGVLYLFGEEKEKLTTNLAEFIEYGEGGQEPDSDKARIWGNIKDSKRITIDDQYNKFRRKDGHTAVEFDWSELCNGSSNSRCDSRRNPGTPDLVVTKWLLRKVVTPTGQEIKISYVANQKPVRYGDWGHWRYNASATYPEEITWNDQKHRVVFVRDENLRQDKGPQKEALERIKEIKVETKLENDAQYHLVRKYTLSYNEDIEGLPDIPNENFTHSYLTSIREFGKDETTTPPITFKYSTAGENNANSAYITKINNGYGGTTELAYEWFAVGYKTKYNKEDLTSSGRWGSYRVRVREKIVLDEVENKSFKEEYIYKEPKGYSEGLGDSSREDNLSCRGCFPPTGLQFLGHKEVETKRYDFNTNGGSLLSRQKTRFYQANEENDCFQPHPAKGSAQETIVFNGELEARKTISTFGIRLDDRKDYDINQCDKELINQPYFVFSKRTDTFIQEPAQVQGAFLPSITNSRLSATDSPQTKSKIRIAQENLEYDPFGNLTKTAAYGEVDFVSGTDLDPSDNRYSYTYYLSNPDIWLLTNPFLSYSSTNPQCAEEDKSCQRRRTEYLYDNKDYKTPPDKGFLTEKRLYNGPDKIYQEKIDYDQYGNLLARLVPRPNQQTTNALVPAEVRVYDNYYHTLLKEVKNAKGFKTIYDEYDPLLQLPLKIKSHVNLSPSQYALQEIEYDGLGRTIKTFAPDPAQYEATLRSPATTTHYFTDGHTLKTRTMSLTSQVNGRFTYSTTDTLYDGLGNVIQTQLLNTKIDGKQQRLVTASLLNANGQVTKMYEAKIASPVEVTTKDIAQPAPTLVTGYKTSIVKETEYDNLGRTRKTTDAQNHTLSYSYQANATKVVDAKKIATITITDSWGRNIWKITEDASSAKKIVTRNTYGKPLIDQPTKTETFSGSGGDEYALATFDYDDAGNLLSTDDPSLGKYSFGYDILGNKISEKNPAGETTYEWDILGRLYRRNYANPLYNRQERNAITFVYDGNANGIGKLSRVEDLIGETGFEYDKGQRTTKVTKRIFDKEREFKSEFNSLSQKKKTIFPQNNRIEYEYDDENRLQKVKLNSNDLLTSAEFNKYGKRSKVNFALGDSSFQNLMNYDILGRIKGLSFKNMEAGGAALFDQEYQYNQTAELAKIQDNLDPQKTFTFKYDGFSQLKSVSGPIETNYEYDIFGRIKVKNEEEDLQLEYDNQSFPLLAPQELVFKEDGQEKRLKLEYDNSGRLKADRERCYSYNQESQLVKIKVKKEKDADCGTENIQQVFDLYYNYEGELSLIDEKNQAGSLSKTRYFYGAYEEIYDKQDASSTLNTRLYIPLSSYVTALKENDKKYLLIKDYLSSTKLIIDEQGGTIAAPDYYPYGGLVENRPSLYADSLPTDRLFTSQRKLPGMDIYNFGARFYHPGLGIFIQPDKAQGLNRFSYANNNPVMLNDPTGNCPWCIGAAVGAVIGGATDIVSQVIIEGTPLRQVNVRRVAISAGAGAISGATGFWVGKAVASVGSAVVQHLAAQAAEIAVVSTYQTLADVTIGDSDPDKFVSLFAENIAEQTVGAAVGAGIGYSAGKAARAVGAKITKELTTSINRLDLPVVEVAGPTEGGIAGINIKQLTVPYHTSNLAYDPVMRSGPGAYVGEVDFAANYFRLPLKSESIGCLAGSCLMRITYKEFAQEAERVVAPEGYVVIQGGYEHPSPEYGFFETITETFDELPFKLVHHGTSGYSFPRDWFIYQKIKH